MSSSKLAIPTTHIGSLPRPPALTNRLSETSTGELLLDEATRELVQTATERVVQRQADVGLDIANNGEQGRTGFHLHVTNRLAGFGEVAPAPFWRDVEAYPAFADSEFAYPDTDPESGAPLRPAVRDEISYQGVAAAEAEITSFRDALAAADDPFEAHFMTAPSPGIVATSLPNQYYDSFDEYITAVGDALRTEYELIADAGMLLQIDAPDLLHTFHRAFPAGHAPDLDPIADYDAVLELLIETINDALRTIPADQVRLHTCWGNYEGPHHLDIALTDVLPQLYELDVAMLAIELSGPAHAHEYQAFSEHPVPTDLRIMPGVVNVKSNVIDHPDTVAMRLERAATAIGDPTKVIATPDCGFGTLAWSAMAPEIVWAKLASLVEGAEIASRRLA